MDSDSISHQAAEALEKIREQKPLVHNITNFVVMNFTANALLACGASPVMAHAIEEVEEMVSLAGALVINIGTLTPTLVESMIAAGKRANQIKVPIILDPVGAGATRLRTTSSRKLLDEVSFAVVRGNASEIRALTKEGGKTKGVDSLYGVDEAGAAAQALAAEFETVVAVTGPVDLITRGGITCRVANGHPLMGSITGMGCAATAIIGAFLSVEPDPLAATAAGLAYLGIAGENAASEARGPGSFQPLFLDALHEIKGEELRARARVTVTP